MAAIASSRDFRLNINEAFNFIARDPAWPRKLGLGAVFSLLSLVLVGAVLVQGYLLTVMERVARAEPEPLPEWDDFGELLRKGLIGWVVSLIYYIPYVALLALIYFGYIGLAIGLPLSSSGNPPPSAIWAPVLFMLGGAGWRWWSGWRPRRSSPRRTRSWCCTTRAWRRRSIRAWSSASSGAIGGSTRLRSRSTSPRTTCSAWSANWPVASGSTRRARSASSSWRT